MNAASKRCPHCQAQLRQGYGAFELVRKGMVGLEHSPGVAIALYSCPKCGYVELYDLKVVAHI